MPPLVVASLIHLLLVHSQAHTVAEAARTSASSSSQVATAAAAAVPAAAVTNQTPANDTGGVDEILRDTFQLLDSLDLKLTQVNNRTKSDDSAREMRSLDDIERDLLAQQDSVEPSASTGKGATHLREQLKSLAAPNFSSEINTQAQQYGTPNIEDDNQLTQLAERFSSVRKSAAVAEGSADSLAAAASSNREHQIFSALISPNASGLAVAAAAAGAKKAARQLNLNDDAVPFGSGTNLGKFDNNFTEKHIRFALDMMRAIFSSQSYTAKSNSIESFLISPVSIQLVLMMMHLGARGQTKRELSNTLHFLSSSLVASNHSSSAVVDALDGSATQSFLSKSAKITRRNPQQQQQSPPKQMQAAKPPQSQTVNQQALNNNVHEQFGAAMRQLLKDSTVARALTSANQIFLQRDLPLSAQYEWAVKHYYGADLKQVDFQNQVEPHKQAAAAAANQSNSTSNNNNNSDNIQQLINDWVERQTRGKISNFLASPVPSSTLLMALNVLFYKGDWQYKFDPADTDPDAWFTRTDGKTVKVPMMVNKLPLAHAHDPVMRTSVIELPYKAQRLGLFILLPDEVNGIFETMQMLNSSSFANLISMMRKPAPSSPNDPHGLASSSGGGGGINVRIPKFSIESSPRLSQILSQQLGLKTLFSPDLADLSGMFTATPTSQQSPLQRRPSLALNQSSPAGEHAPPQVGLDELLHKAVLQVHEQGSVAAASSATIVERVGLFNGQYFEADHPFLVFLMDKQTGLVLFSGVYAGSGNPPGGDSGPVQQQQSFTNGNVSSNSTADNHSASARSPKTSS